jgi:sec-independent protein translocase protein TatB
MLDVGFSEILLTSAIALIVLGPERLPRVARQVGNWLGRARAMARQLSEQLEREVSAEELLKTQSKPNRIADLPRASADVPVGGAGLDPVCPPSLAANGTAPGTGAPASAASTTAAAMHGDPPADSTPSHE